MGKIYSSPLKVYLALGLLTLLGIWLGTQLPVSLFPNTNKPTVTANFSLESNPDDFIRNYGSNIEYQLKSISMEGCDVEKVESRYSPGNASYRVFFKWDCDGKIAVREVRNLMTTSLSYQSVQVRNSLNVWSYNEGSGFFAASFYSSEMSTQELYDTLRTVLGPKLTQIPDAEGASVWNPESKEVSITLNPQILAAHEILPQRVGDVVTAALEGANAGTLQTDPQPRPLTLPPLATKVADFQSLNIPSPKDYFVKLSDIAHVDLSVPLDGTKSIKTSGSTSVMVWAQPRSGGNIKKMSEDVIEAINQAMPLLPSHVHYKILVDPSEFIRSSILNVIKEVFLAAFLAVLVLFVFIGSFKNVATAAIEIPISLIMAFILMKLSNMNLNMISLAGLALSAGMNVDGSVVVMENIFRHFESVKRKLSYSEKLSLLCDAVAEVRLPIIASTIASVVVFLPLIYTKGLASAILGDLAKAVVFSHSLSAIVALVLVPTVRLQMMKSDVVHEHQTIFEPFIRKIESFYSKTLKLFINSSWPRYSSYVLLTVGLVLLITLVIPKIPKEIIGRPDSDMVFVSVNTQGNTVMKQMESVSDEVELKILTQFPEYVSYTYVETGSANSSWILIRMKDKSKMSEFIKKLEDTFTNTATTQFWIESWNPSELPLPNPPQLKIAITAKEASAQVVSAKQISDSLQEHKVFARIRTEPNSELQKQVVLKPRYEQWPALQADQVTLMPQDLVEMTRIVTNGKSVGNMTINDENVWVYLRYPKEYGNDLNNLESMPLSVKDKIIPLKALMQFDVADQPAMILRVDQKPKYYVLGRVDDADKSNHKQIEAKIEESKKLVAEWKQKYDASPEAVKTPVNVEFEDANIELTESLSSLKVAVIISILLIFVTMIYQLNGVANSLLVLIAVPLGFIGVVLSLYIFKSTISLNSALGVILLNGIVVANSIILVDFLNRLVDRGMTPKEAAQTAGESRLRPILMTSMTTGLGMLPIALGFGEGGKILQPLGITVCGGLIFSTLTTLYIVPSLQVAYLEWNRRGLK